MQNKVIRISKSFIILRDERYLINIAKNKFKGLKNF